MIVGTSPAMQQLMKIVVKVARTDAHHQVITGINHIGHPVENPESGVPGESDVIGAVHTGVAYGRQI